jgi:MinD-like ATPase involved in chromosome partitioning or flagellar assembly
MTAVAVLAGKASPGATTVAAAMTLAWPGPVLLVDADPAGGDVVPGLLPGRAGTELGLLSWVVATRHQPALEATAVLVEHALALPEAGDAWLLPGLQSGAQGQALTGGGWARLATAVERCRSVLGRDVVVDVGRVGEGCPWPVVAACDVVLLVTRPTARSVQAAQAAAAALRTRLGDLNAVRLVVNGPGPYSPAQVAAQLRVAQVESIPADPRTAAALVDGSVAPVRGLTRSRLVQAAGLLAERVSQPARSTAGG